MSASSENFAGQRVTIMGLGLFGGGASAARYLAERGAIVTVTDLRDAAVLAPAVAELADLDLNFVLGEHRARDFIACDWLVVNPAVSPRNQHLLNAHRAGVRSTSEIALFLDACPARVVGVTGTQGKSSTTHYLAQLLSSAGLRTHLGGNIGHSLLGELDAMTPEDVCVVELSSYQLESLPEHLRISRRESPIVAGAITNVYADHLERHGTREEYALAKLRLLECLRPGSLILMPREPLPVDFTTPEDIDVLVPGGSELRIEAGEFRMGDKRLGLTADANVDAPFQLENLLIALGLAAHLGAAPKALAAALPNLSGLPHRLSHVGELAGRPLWDNGVSTTPDSTISALKSLPLGFTVLLGGRTKALDLKPLLEALRRREATVVLFGEAGPAWSKAFEQAEITFEVASGPLEALEVALRRDSKGILFSPACSSFDAYPNFAARARAFLELARSLGLSPSRGRAHA